MKQKAFEAESNWNKGNMHTHTTNADGAFKPKYTVEHYQTIGF